MLAWIKYSLGRRIVVQLFITRGEEASSRVDSSIICASNKVVEILLWRCTLEFNFDIIELSGH